MDKITLGISACLLGEPVRYDGSHKLDRFLRDTLGRSVAYLPVCPEVECGFGVPREAMHLEGDPTAPRLITNHSRRDLTEQMLAWVQRRLQELATANLCGFVFKSDSPSSGMERVEVIDAAGIPRRTGSGLFAAAFMRRFPHLPVTDEVRLRDPAQREAFVERLEARG